MIMSQHEIGLLISTRTDITGENTKSELREDFEGFVEIIRQQLYSLSMWLICFMP